MSQSLERVKEASTCQGKTSYGTPCRRRVRPGQIVCYQHAVGWRAKWHALPNNKWAVFGIAVLGVVATLAAWVFPELPHWPEPLAVEALDARWDPVDQKAPGISVKGSRIVTSVPWQLLKLEIETHLLPQVDEVAKDSVVQLRDFRGKPNWIIEIKSPAGDVVGNVWFGPDPTRRGAYDGLVRVGPEPLDVNDDSEKTPYASRQGPIVWETFQRYSDGSYRRRAQAQDAITPLGTAVTAAPIRVKTKKNPRDGLIYVWISPGPFKMGCSPDDSQCDHGRDDDDRDRRDESPLHLVAITKGFWLGQTPVTQAAYQQVTGRMNQNRPNGDQQVRDMNPSHFKGDDQRPVDSVIWKEADDYCNAVGMRLPTEAEWEYAARAGSEDSRYGDIESIAWYCDNSGTSNINCLELWENDSLSFLSKIEALGGRTHPVGQKLPNEWKLYDMLGNVWQWTADWYDKDYYGKISLQHPAKDPHGPTGPISDNQRVMRGGSWHNGAWVLRASRRGPFKAGDRNNGIGFRCAGETIPSTAY